MCEEKPCSDLRYIHDHLDEIFGTADRIEIYASRETFFDDYEKAIDALRRAGQLIDELTQEDFETVYSGQDVIEKFLIRSKFEVKLARALQHCEDPEHTTD